MLRLSIAVCLIGGNGCADVETRHLLEKFARASVAADRDGDFSARWGISRVRGRGGGGGGAPSLQGGAPRGPAPARPPAGIGQAAPRCACAGHSRRSSACRTVM